MPRKYQALGAVSRRPELSSTRTGLAYPATSTPLYRNEGLPPEYSIFVPRIVVSTATSSIFRSESTIPRPNCT